MTDAPNARAAAAKAASPFLCTKQAAFYLAISVATLEKFRSPSSARKGPRFRRHGGRVFYHIDDLQRWSEAGQ